MAQIHIETLGCRLNQIESEAIAGAFTNQNFSVSMSPVTSNSEVDVSVYLCIINTCTVTQKAEQKARRIIRLLLKKYPLATILVTGCYAQLSADEIEKIDKRICAVGGQIKSRIVDVPQLLNNELQDFNAISFVNSLKKEICQPKQEQIGFAEHSFRLAASSLLSHSRPSLKIQDGCNSCCSYCAIHFARGHSVSIDVGLALKRVKELEEKGNDELVLTTVNISQYKCEYQGQLYNFAKLLQYLLDNTTSINFRISSLYPQIVDEEFCSVISNPRVRPHFHISVQSGSDNILASMQRAYKADAVRTACERLRQVKKDCFLACDIITGFPGEKDEDFEETMKLLADCDFTWVHAFPFSERPGTLACNLKNKVPQSVSGERCRRINDWAVANKIKYLEKMLGSQHPAILENARHASVMKTSYIYHAVTDNFIHCEIISNKPLTLGKMVKLRITGILSERIRKGGETEVSAEII
ncbi:MAG: tRNA (N(6)-L-threonylcarbamoyladenosine(37)-C(2))-methylthiotransferase MtaB [Treponema sp.]|nr:tRNA (N(6)-L-threonylcarbamoyladenosine(37)-C(2))-methylthiotransferase MtaB [Treponema sp.]